MSDRRPHLLDAKADDPIWILWRQLPPQWQGPVIGDGIEDWEAMTENGDRRIDVSDLPEVMMAELAWMAHWQAMDGTRVSVLGTNQLANVLRYAITHKRPFPSSIRQLDWDTAAALQKWFYVKRWNRWPPKGSVARVRVMFRFARLALIAACDDRPWWALDEWHPRCDPRIPLSGREPQAHYGCSPSLIKTAWLREAVKWHLGTQMQAGVLRWSTVSQERMRCFHRFDRWIRETMRYPVKVLNPAAITEHAAAFRRWTADPDNRLLRANDQRFADRPVYPRGINDDLRAIAELFGFIAANQDDAFRVLGPGPWDKITEAHAAGWFRQVSRISRVPDFNAQHYVDDHALAQIPAALPLIGLPGSDTMPITRGDGTQATAHGLDDPQAMRMILLQIMTGRRSSEIRTCRFDCLSPLPARASDASPGNDVVKFHYAQTKIDIAPDNILVGQDVAAVIEEQQQWVREQFPGLTPRHLFMQRTGNRRGGKTYPSGTYNWILRRFSDIVQIVDSKGNQVSLSQTHRFRHTKLTRLAELGLPIHVLQRYAGHATPTMSMHYIAQREEHAEQAFLATVKLKADGTRITLSREDHDGMHLFDRADRFLPHGWCLLPALQSCDKGNACLTCALFVTDDTHQSTLDRQLTETQQLIARTTTAFQARHGQPMPDDNVWLTQRRTEQAALTKLLATMREQPGQALQAGGCGAAPRPTPVSIDLGKHRRTRL